MKIVSCKGENKWKSERLKRRRLGRETSASDVPERTRESVGGLERAVTYGLHESHDSLLFI